MGSKVNITLKNGKTIKVERGTTLEKVSQTVQDDYKAIIVAAKVNNKLKELNYQVERDTKVEFIDLTTIDGQRIYQRGLSFVFIRAAMELLPDCKVSVEHSLSKGLYCEIRYKRPINEKDVENIEERMKEIIDEDIPFIKEKVAKEKAREIFKNTEWKQRKSC